jgi:hippurate hydrolase
MTNPWARLTTLLVLAVSTLPAADAQARVSELVAAEVGSLVQLYAHLHRHPELSFHEKETAAKLISELKPLGFEVTANVGGHGFVAVMKNGSGPTVLVRTDLDALPVVENTARPYASDVRTTDENGNDVGVMHACGHDIHMTSFIGTARVLVKLKDQWSGTLVMIGQPAEERGAGAKAMLDDGLFRRFPRPDYALGLHVDAALETGRVGYHTGYALANVDSVDITIRGVGGHGAYPHNTKDPIVIAAQVILALQTIVSREVRPIDSAVVTVGSIHGGAKHNVISDEVKLQLTVRSYTDAVRQQILDAIQRITVGIARAAGVPADREPTVKVIEEEFTPALYNNPELGTRLLPVWRRMFGEDRVVERDAEMGGEDFSRYGREEPRISIFMFRLGTIDAARMAAADQGGAPLPSLHSALFWPVPDTTVETGVKAMTAAVLELMGKK